MQSNNFARFLPSKSFMAITAALLFSCALVFGIYKITSSGSDSTASNSLLTPTLAAVDSVSDQMKINAAEKDSDGDGLKDWEEFLWGTDPNNSDTDGDKTSDGEEVKLNRNPLVKGPKDLPTPNKEQGVKLSKLANTVTDEVARAAFAQYIEAKQDGKEISPDLQKQLVINAISLGQNKGPQNHGRLYTESDLTIVETNKDSITKYGNSMGEIILNANWKEREAEIIKKALDSNDSSQLSKLDSVISGYQGVVDGILKVNVPRDAVRDQLNLLNSFSEMITSLKSLKNTFSDPVEALAAFGKYPDYVTDLYRSFVSASGIFTRNNISYNQNDTGFIFANFAQIMLAASKKTN